LDIDAADQLNVEFTWSVTNTLSAIITVAYRPDLSDAQLLVLLSVSNKMPNEDYQLQFILNIHVEKIRSLQQIDYS